MENKQNQYTIGKLAPYFLLRIPGWPLSLLDELVSEPLTEILTKACEIQNHIARSRDHACDSLYGAVERAKTDTKGRRALLAVKRCFFADTLPKNSDFTQIQHNLTPQERSVVQQQYSLLSDWYDALQEIITVFKSQQTLNRQQLKAFAADVNAQRAAGISNPVLLRRLERFAKVDAANLSKKARKAETSVSKTLLRSTTRSTPLSRFSAVAWGTTRADVTGDTQAQNISSYERALITLNPVILRRLVTSLEANPEIRRNLPVRINPSAGKSESEISWLNLVPCNNDWLVDSCQQRWSKASLSIPIASVLQAGTHEFIDREKYVKNLLSVLSMSEERIAEIDALLDKLIQAGLLEAKFQISDFDLCPASLAAGLQKLDNHNATEIAQRLLDIDQQLSQFSDALPSARQAVYESVVQQLESIGKIAGVELNDFQHLVLFEDCAHTVNPVSIARDLLPPDGLAITALHTLACVYDPGLIMREAVREVIKVSNVKELPLSEVLLKLNAASVQWQQVTAQSSDTSKSPTTLDLSFPGLQTSALEMLRKTQFALHEELQNLLQQSSSAHCNLDPEALLALLSPLKTLLPQKGAIAVFGTPVSDDPESLFAIRSIFAGLGKPVSRFTRLLDTEDNTISSKVSQWIAEVMGPEKAVADMGTSFGHAGSIRNSLTSFEIEIPTSVGRLAQSQKVPMAEIYIALTGEHQLPKVRWRKNEKEVICLDLGFLHGLAYPQFAQVLTQIAPVSSGPYLELLLDGVRRCEQGIKRTPRLNLGAFILMPESWWICRDTLPPTCEDAADPHWLLAVYRWRKENGIPDRVMMRQHTAVDWLKARAQEADPNVDFRAGEGASRKNALFPLLLDFTSPSGLVLLAEALSKHPEYLLFEEANNLGNTLINVNSQVHASEMVLELGSS